MRVWLIDTLHQGQHALSLLKQALSLPLGLLAQDRDDTPALLRHLLGSLDELLIQFLLLSLFFFSFAPQLPMQGLGHLPRGAQP